LHHLDFISKNPRNIIPVFIGMCQSAADISLFSAQNIPAKTKKSSLPMAALPQKRRYFLLGSVAYDILPDS